jgi:plasmid stabilization system protein ParE
MLPLAFHPLVEADLADSAEWYGRQQPGLEERFLAEVHKQFSVLPADALLYAVRFADIRRVNLKVFKHGVFYFIADDAVVVLAVLHGHRDTKQLLANRRRTFLDKPS